MSNSDKFPTDFVPVSRPLVEELGYQAAYVFGVIWQYCQMKDKVCKASHDKIAERAGMSRRSVIDYIEKLTKVGYIEDLTPDVRNAPHQLCTKKGVQILHSKEQELAVEEPAQEPERYETPTSLNGGGVQELHSGYANSAQSGMQILHKNRQNKEKRLSKDNGAKAPSDKGIIEPGPKTQLMNEFLSLSGLSMPYRKTDQNFWWGSIGELYELFNRDVDVGKNTIRQVIDELRRDRLRITGPESLVKTARDVMAQKNYQPRISLK